MPNIQLQLLLSHHCTAAEIRVDADVQIRVHPTNYTCTVSIANQKTAVKLVKIRSIILNAKAYVVAAYMVPAADTARGMISNAFRDETKKGFFKNCKREILKRASC